MSLLPTRATIERTDWRRGWLTTADCLEYLGVPVTHGNRIRMSLVLWSLGYQRRRARGKSIWTIGGGDWGFWGWEEERVTIPFFPEKHTWRISVNEN